MLFELSRYRSPTGRFSEARALVEGGRGALGDHLLGMWGPDGGAVPDRFLALCLWPDFETRERVHGALLDDPGQRSGVDPALVDTEHWIVTASAGAPGEIALMQSDELYEFRFQEVVNGSQPAAGRAFWERTRPEIEAAGGRVAGQFDVVLGPGRPVFVTILAWADHPALFVGWRALDRSPAMVAGRQAETGGAGRSNFERPEQWLMRSMPPS